MKQLSLLLLGAACAAPALAADADNADPTALQSTVVVTSNRETTGVGDITGNIGIISSAQIDATAATHPNEVMNKVPGVMITRGNGQEHLTAIRSPVLTGAGSCAAFIVAEDNVPTRPRAFCNVNELFEVNTEQAERIEVIRGPGNAFFGSGAVHGVVNVVSKAPPQEFSGNVGLEAGPHEYYRSKASLGDSNGKHAYRLSLNGVHDGGYKDDSGFDQQKLNARYDYRGEKVTVRNSLALANLNQETAGYVVGKDAYKDEDRKKENPNPEAYRDAQAARFASSIEIAGTNDSKLVLTPYLRWADMNFLMHFQPGAPIEKSGFHSAGVQTAFYQSLSDTTTVVSGFDMDYSDGFLEQFQPEDGPSPRFPQGDQYDYNVYTRTLSPFIQVENALTSKLTMTTGLRWEHNKYTYHNNLPAGSACDPSVQGCRYTRPDSGTERFYDWSPKWGLRYDISDSYISYVNLARSHRAPHSAELFRLEGNQTVADIDSEQIDSIEFGVRGGGDVFSSEMNIFGMHKRNVIFKNSDRQNIDGAKTKHYGIEISGTYAPVPWFDVELATSFARHRYSENADLQGTSDGSIRSNEITSAPRHIDRLQLGFNPWEGGRIAVEWLHVGKYYLNPENTYAYGGHDLANVRIQQKWMDLTFGLRIMNATDEDYAERADLTPIEPEERYFIGEPRSYYVTVDYGF